MRDFRKEKILQDPFDAFEKNTARLLPPISFIDYN